MLLLRALFGRKGWWVTLLVLGVMALFVRLGFWQLDRLEQRRAANAALVAALAAPPLELTDAPLSGDLENLKDRQVVAQGVFDFEEQIVLLVQNWQGRPGVHLVAPLVVDSGETAVLVDRGWIPEADYKAGDLSRFDEVGEVTVNGFVTLSQTLSRQNNARPVTPQDEVYRVDIDAIRPQLPYDVYPFYVTQAPAIEGNVAPPFRAEREIDLSEGPHLSYAIQWFIFCLLSGVLYVVFVNKSLASSGSIP
jgi:surfeit locus 1 family protein